MDKRVWKSIGSCVKGASHVRNGMPCQDALRVERAKDCHIVAISDGHGSASCPYSDEGARVAVDTACAVFASIINKGDPFTTISSNKDIWLPKQIEQKWKSTVSDLHAVKGREEEFSYELYGATLLAMVVSDDFVFALQLGDGDILSVNEGVDWFIPPDGGLGPETNSLCQDDCWQYMKTRIIPLPPGEAGPMFMLSTDGYANSFSSDSGFKQAGSDFYGLWKDEGPGYIEENLNGWLMESSAQGSGDDIALALILDCHLDYHSEQTEK